MLQLEHWFRQQNGLELRQVQDWYPNKKMVTGPSMFEW